MRGVDLIGRQRYIDKHRHQAILEDGIYRRWEAGTLTEGELAAYAEQYRHIERELPVTLAAKCTEIGTLSISP